MSTSFRKVNETKFKLTSVTTPGMSTNEFGELIIPMYLDQDTADGMSALASEYGTQNPVFAPPGSVYRMMYLGAGKLSSTKRTARILNRGALQLTVHFAMIGVRTDRDDTRHLCFRATKLRRATYKSTADMLAPL